MPASRKLRDALLSNYDKYARPVKDHTTVTYVWFEIYVDQLVDVVSIIIPDANFTQTMIIFKGNVHRSCHIRWNAIS
ncbi:hypothetical protein B4U80_12471, partial [Leptotrombidium deliense]